MVLRKPYALFIKYFRLLHAAMAVFIAFILYRAYSLYNFFRTYSLDYRAVMGDFTPEKYLNAFGFLMVFLVLVVTGMMLAVMIYKKKPKFLYIYNIILYILILVLYYFCNITLDDIQSTVLTIQTSKAFRDFALIALMAEAVSFILVVVRAIGFDIKQFDFSKDLKELEISELDNEEFEVAIEFDQAAIKRNVKSKIRNFRYVYVEHKFIINSILGSLTLVLLVFIYLKVSAYTDYFKQGSTVSANGFSFIVQDAYVLNSDLNGNELVDTEGENAGAIVAIRFKVKGSYKKQVLNTGLVTLRIGSLIYRQNAEIAKKLYDIGESYTDQELSDEFETYILAFEIGDSQSKKSMKLYINDGSSYIDGKIGAKNDVVRLKIDDLRKEGENYTKKVSETVNFEDSVLGKSSLTINSFNVGNAFKLNYKYCYGDNKCTDSSEYITPTLTGNYFKALLELSGNVVIDKDAGVKGIYDIRSFLNQYAMINYKVNDVWYSKKINSKVIKPKTAKTSNVYIEVPYEVNKASEISLTFKIRNYGYKYVLK